MAFRVLAIGLCLAMASGCASEDPSPLLSGDGGGFEAAPPRMVSEELPDGFLSPRDVGDVPPTGVGSNPIVSPDGGIDASSPRPPDAPADLGPVATCSIIRQDCPPGQGCYPGADGRGACAPAGQTEELTPCLDHDQCQPGRICAEVFGVPGGTRLCTRACDPAANPPCPQGAACLAQAGSAVGACSP